MQHIKRALLIEQNAHINLVHLPNKNMYIKANKKNGTRNPKINNTG